MSNIIDITYIVITDDDKWEYKRDELSYAMKFAQNKNGTLRRIVIRKNNVIYVDEYDFDNLRWKNLVKDSVLNK